MVRGTCHSVSGYASLTWLTKGIHRFLYATSVLSNFFAGGYSLLRDDSYYSNPSGSKWSKFINLALSIIAFPLILLAVVVILVFSTIFGWLPTKWQGALRYSVRYTRRW